MAGRPRLGGRAWTWRSAWCSCPGRASSAGCAITVLRAIRRRGPGAARRRALFALVFLCGEAGLDAADLAMVRRLIRIKAPRDVPYAFDACFNGRLAARGGDQRGVVAVLGLADAAPATSSWWRRWSAT